MFQGTSEVASVSLIAKCVIRQIVARISQSMNYLTRFVAGISILLRRWSFQKHTDYTFHNATRQEKKTTI